MWEPAIYRLEFLVGNQHAQLALGNAGASARLVDESIADTTGCIPSGSGIDIVYIPIGA